MNVDASARMALALAEIFKVGEAPMRWTFSGDHGFTCLDARPARSLLRVFGLPESLDLRNSRMSASGQGLDHFGHLGQDLGDLAR